METHSPLRVKPDTARDPYPVVVSEDGQTVVQVLSGLPDATYIVQACNAYPALLKALEAVYAALDDHYDVDRRTDRTTEYPFPGAGLLMDQARAALALGTGRGGPISHRHTLCAYTAYPC